MSFPLLRFAPSPTGYLHVGGARTALFNWLYARQQGGQFLLRIEDTDRERSTPQAVEAIFAGLRWLGLDWDGEPLFQSTRLQEHQALVDELLQHGAAYRCFCDPEELSQKQRAAEKNGSNRGYPGTCRNLSDVEIQSKIQAGQPFAVRFSTPPGETIFHDSVHDEIRVQNHEVDDFILLRRDGTPVYQVAVVADDLHMGITHIIRGDDHISNTPKQILIYQALGQSVPQFAHVPLILGPDKKRLSKRHGATSVVEYRDRGILPEALRNFLALLGWNPGDDREVMTLEELISAFSLEGINPSGAVFDESKLEWMNGQYIARLTAEEVWEEIRPYLQSWCKRQHLSLPDDSYGVKLSTLFRERLRLFSEAPDKMDYFLRDPVGMDPAGLKKHWKPHTENQVQQLSQALAEVETWTHGALEARFDRLADQMGIKRAELIHPVRLLVTGKTSSPGIFEVLELLGREATLRRLQKLPPPQ